MSEVVTEEVEEPDELTEGEPEEEHEQESEPDDDEVAEPEPAHEDEPEATSSAQTPEEVEKRMKALDKENLRHFKRVGEILEEDAQALEPCPRCFNFAAGLIFPPGMMPVSAEMRAAVKASIGEGVQAELQPADDAYVCSKCQGLGMVGTGSFVAGQEQLVCRACNGRGWEGPRAATAVGAPLSDGAPSVGVQVTPAQEAVDADPWGRTPDHPDYGRLPGFVKAVNHA